MRFAFTPEQLALRDAVRSLLASAFPPSALSAAWEAPAGSLDLAVWLALGEMGVFDVLVPAADGGLGLDWCSLVLVLEETGRAALPHPVAATAAVAAPLLASLAGPVPPGSMITSSLAGEAAVCGADADFFVVDRDDSLWLVPGGAVQGRCLQTVDRGRRLMSVDAVDLSRGRFVGEGGAEVEAALGRAALGAAAQLLGLSQAMLDMTVEYVSERHQFGVPVGSFQAVKHQLVDALKELSFARPVVYRAAWSLSVRDPDAAVHVSMAKAMASDAAELVASTCLQCHGALGYAYEYGLHRLMKRAWALARSSGSAAWHRGRVAEHLALVDAD
jgi:alkylation response protein AidB-like acyl-CoA dehydrogenase